MSIQTTDCEKTDRYGSVETQSELNVLNYVRDLRDIFSYPLAAIYSHNRTKQSILQSIHQHWDHYEQCYGLSDGNVSANSYLS